MAILRKLGILALLACTWAAPTHAQVTGAQVSQEELERYRRTAPASGMTDAELRARYGMSGNPASQGANATGRVIGQTWVGGGSTTGTPQVLPEDAELVNRYNGARSDSSLGGQARASAPETARFVSDVFGVEGATAEARGITRDGAGKSSIQARYTVTVPCSRNEGSVSMGPYAGSYTCKGESATLKLCSPGRYCTKPGDFTELTVSKNAAKGPGYEVSAEFRTRNSKREVTFRLVTVEGYNAAAEPTTPASALQQDSYQNTMAKSTSGADYQTALTTHARDNMRCLQYTADGTTCLTQEKAGLGTLVAGGSTSNLECGDPVCTKQTVNKTEWTESCNRGVDMTTYSCTYVRVPISCNYLTGQPRVCGSGISDPVSSGYTKTSEEREPVECPPDTPSSVKECFSITESWISPEMLSGQCSVSPLALLSTPEASCENRGKGILRTSCSAWFGRTLTDSACTSPGDGDETEPYAMDEAMRPGCGYCLRAEYTDSCVARAPVADGNCPAAGKSECRLTSVECLEASTVGSTPHCYAQKETYTCSKEESSCLAWEQPAGCEGVTDVTGGTSSLPIKRQTSNMAGFGQAAASLGVADAVSQSINDAAAEEDDLAWFAKNGGLPKVFTGKHYACSEGRLKGIGAGVNCCKIDLERPKEGLANDCDLDDVKLAALRRKNQTHYVGRYCAKSIKIFGKKICYERKQSYCTFDGILPRIVQQQGREQLATFAAMDKSGDVTRSTSSLPYMGSGNGGWSAPIPAGPDILIRRWQWPAYCSSVEASINALTQNPDLPDCPTVPEMFWATCVGGPDGVCGEPPATPLDTASGWTVSRTNPLVEETTPIHRLAWVHGSCDTSSQQCTYAVAAWPASRGGRAVISRDTEFLPTTGQPPEEEGALTEPGEFLIIGNTVVRPVIQTGSGGASLAAVPVQYSTDNGVSWGQMNVAIPAGAPQPVSIPGSTEGVTVELSCEQVPGFGETVNRCRLRAVGTVIVTTKPWGAPKNPDCTGFTMGQFTVLDFERMDLSEWIAELTKELGGKLDNIASAVGGQAKQMADSYFAQFGGSVAADGVTFGPDESASPLASQSVWISPREDYGPFTVSIRVTGNWPRWYEKAEDNKNPVRQVIVDWNDCTAPQTLVAEMQGGRPANFTGSHDFLSPDKIGCGIGGRKDIEHQVRVRVVAQNGTEELTYKVRNVWRDFKGNVVQEKEKGTNIVKQDGIEGGKTSDRGTVTTTEKTEGRKVDAVVPGASVYRSGTRP